MKKFKMSLEKISSDLMKVAKQIDEVVAQLDTQTTSKPAKKTAVKRVSKQKVSAKQPAAIDTVFNLIKGYRRGASVAAIKKKTGYDDKKIHNLVYKLKKQRKIKNVARGVYGKV
jgi:anti-sigma factor ChrR (cupin superfamily)